MITAKHRPHKSQAKCKLNEKRQIRTHHQLSSLLYTVLRPFHTIRFEGSDSWFRKLDAGVQTDFKVLFLSASFIFQEECRMKIEHVLFPSVFPKLRICVSEGHSCCVHTIQFSEPIKSDRVNGPLERKGLYKLSGKSMIERLPQIKICMTVFA